MDNKKLESYKGAEKIHDASNETDVLEKGIQIAFVNTLYMQGIFTETLHSAVVNRIVNRSM